MGGLALIASAAFPADCEDCSKYSSCSGGQVDHVRLRSANVADAILAVEKKSPRANPGYQGSEENDLF